MQTAEVLQSAIRGHMIRQKNINRLRSNSLDRRVSVSSRGTAAADDSETDDTAEILQAHLRAHNYRRQALSR
jgi:hypothetical protein